MTTESIKEKIVKKNVESYGGQRSYNLFEFSLFPNDDFNEYSRQALTRNPSTYVLKLIISFSRMN